jgi:tetratricopeptide (TPR) repeat protein
MTKSIKKETAHKLLRGGQALRAEGRTAEAVEKLRRALAMLTDDPEILVALAGAEEESGNHDEAARLRTEAEGTIKEIIRARPGETWTYKLLAIIYSKTGSPEKSAAVLAHALARFGPAQASFFFPQGSLTSDEAQLAAFAETTDEEIALLAQSPAGKVRHHAATNVLTLMGYAAAARRSFLLAIQCFEKEMEAYSPREELALNIGVCHAMLYQPEAAKQWFARARRHHAQTITNIFAGDDGG